MPKNKFYFSIIIPVHNGSSTIKESFSSLNKQKNKKLIKKIFIIDDNSSDNSLKLIKNIVKKTKFSVTIIKNKHSLGLAQNYNKTIKKTKTNLVIIMHQDIILQNNNSFEILLNEFQNNKNLFCSYPTIIHPKKFWNRYNFWQKMLFSRYVDKNIPIQIGKFDCFNKLKLIKLGLFNKNNFRTAGEDMDLIIRAKKQHLLSKPNKIKVLHLHNTDPKFSFFDFLKKENQLAETKGVLLRIHGPFIPTYKSFFRELLIIGLLIPTTRFLSLFLIFLYCFIFNNKMYKEKDIKIILLPIINLILFFNNIFFTIKSFLSKKQKI